MSGANWGNIDPNSQHQLWSEWRFLVYEGTGTKLHIEHVKRNVHLWAKQTFRTTDGVMNVEQLPSGYKISLIVEGASAHDPTFYKYIDMQFTSFVRNGWGAGAIPFLECKILAGDKQDGKPRDQMIVMPTLDTNLENTL